MSPFPVKAFSAATERFCNNGVNNKIRRNGPQYVNPNRLVREMKALGHLLIATLCSVLVLGAGFYLGSVFLVLFDSNYHDGFAAVGGLIIGLIMAAVVFRAVIKRL